MRWSSQPFSSSFLRPFRSSLIFYSVIVKQTRNLIQLPIATSRAVFQNCVEPATSATVLRQVTKSRVNQEPCYLLADMYTPWKLWLILIIFLLSSTAVFSQAWATNLPSVLPAAIEARIAELMQKQPGLSPEDLAKM